MFKDKWKKNGIIMLYLKCKNIRMFGKTHAEKLLLG